MRGTKTTVYLPEELRRTVKKHLIDTGETLSKFVEIALENQLAYDKTRAGKKRLKAKQQADELDKMIKDLARE
ncbi:MAG: hypothetical protein Q4C83_01245 [Candidatus Saccharibacteria bacterium]|nr:hypothetical protein [Candidatus Saccharibacteria bacterium]